MSNGNIGGRESLKKYKRESTKKVWKRQWARRKNRKERVSGKMLMEVKKDGETRGVEGTRRGKKGRRNNSYESRHRRRRIENNRSICKWRHGKKDRETKKVYRKREERKDDNDRRRLQCKNWDSKKEVRCREGRGKREEVEG